MEAETTTQQKLSFTPIHKSNRGIVTGELRSKSGSYICTIEENNAKDIMKSANMHNEALDIILEFVRESKSNTSLVKKAVELLNKDKE